MLLPTVIRKTSMPQRQHARGGTLIGFVLGLLLGVGGALAVAVYVTKVPVPFVDRGITRKAEQDVQEAERNKGWNPNAGMGFKHELPAPPAQPADAAAPAQPAAAPPAEPDALGELLKDKAAVAPEGTSSAAATVTAPAAAPAAATNDKLIFFVQAGAFRSADEAEAQRARLALLGVSAQVTEREQAGKPIFRVRLGPFKEQDKAESTLSLLKGGGVEAALVRVQQP
jgi:cell division protein FtsN